MNYYFINAQISFLPFLFCEPGLYSTAQTVLELNFPSASAPEH